MKPVIVFGDDYEAFFRRILTDRSFFYRLNKEVFDREEAGPVNIECYHDGNYSNSCDIQKVIRHVTGHRAMVYDEIDDNGYLRSIYIEFLAYSGERQLPNIEIEVTWVGGWLTDSQYYDELDRYLTMDHGKDYLYVVVLDAIYTMLEKLDHGPIKDNKYHKFYTPLDLYIVDVGHQIPMTKKELKAECKRLAETHIKKSLSAKEREWLINNVLSHHPRWEWWEKQGVKDIYADYNKEHYYSLGFWIVFADGTKADISYTKSIKNL